MTQPIRNSSYMMHCSSSDVKKEVKKYTIAATEYLNRVLTNNFSAVSSQHHYESYGSVNHGPVIINNHHYVPYLRSPSLIVVENDSYRKKTKNDEATMLIGILAVVGFLIASYTMGTAIATRSAACYELDKSLKFQRNFRKLELRSLKEEDKKISKEAFKAAKLNTKMCYRMKNSANVELGFRATLPVCFATTAATAFFANSLLPLALISTVAVSAALLFKWGYESVSNSQMYDAEKLQNRLKKLENYC